MNIDTQIKFWDDVDVGEPDECWPYRASAFDSGYGRFRYAGKALRAHRVAFLLTHGHWPTPCCLHSCDNRPCCNPAHLREGTDADNIADMVAKGRQSRGPQPNAASSQRLRGEQHPDAVLTEADVQELRRKHADGEPIRALARSSVASRAAVAKAIKGITWKHLDSGSR